MANQAHLIRKNLGSFSGVAERIAKFNPEARFIYIMRDPIERTISHYWFNVRLQGEQRDMLTAIRNNPHIMDRQPLCHAISPILGAFRI